MTNKNLIHEYDFWGEQKELKTNILVYFAFEFLSIDIVKNMFPLNTFVVNAATKI